jgi:hypothetical protein
MGEEFVYECGQWFIPSEEQEIGSTLVDAKRRVSILRQILLNLVGIGLRSILLG